MSARDLDVRIRDVLQSVAGCGLDARSLSDGDNLYDAGLKSLATLQFLLALEDEFGVEFPESMLHQDAFSAGTVLEPTFIAGMLLQLPFAVVALLLARALLVAAGVLARELGTPLRFRPAPDASLAVPTGHRIPAAPTLVGARGQRAPPLSLS